MPSKPDIGEVLKKEREKQGLSLSDIAKKTLIRKFYLEQIESNDFPRYDGYIAAYIRRYAEALGIAPEPLVEEYKKLFPEEVHPELLEKEAKRSKFPVVFSVIVSIAILAIIGFFITTHKKQAPPPQNTNQSTENTQNNESQKKPSVPQEGENKSNENSQKTPVEKKAQGVKVTVTVDAKCWIGVTIDGKYEQFMLYKGQSKTFVGKKYIKILYGNAMHAYVTENGKDLGVVSKNKRVVEVIYKAQ